MPGQNLNPRTLKMWICAHFNFNWDTKYCQQVEGFHTSEIRRTNISGNLMGFCRCSVKSSVKPVNVGSYDVVTSQLCASRHAGCYLYLQWLRSKPSTDPTLPAPSVKPRSGQTWTSGIIANKILISQTMWKSVFIFCPRAEMVNVLIMPRVEFKKKGQSFFKSFKKKKKCYVLRSQLHFVFQFRSTLLQRAVFGLERSHCLFLPEQLGLFSIRSSVHIQIRFSNSLSSSFFFPFFSSHFWGWGVLCLYWV